MNIQQYDPKIVSVTQLRRDMSVLDRILEKEDKALVVKNHQVVYEVTKPQADKKKISDAEIKKRKKLLEQIRKFRDKRGDGQGTPVTDYLIQMREARKYE